MNKKILNVLLFSLILFPGCYSFYSINVNDLRNLNGKENIEVRLKNKESIKIYNTNKINFTNGDSILILNNDSLKSSFSEIEVKEIAVEKFDYIKTTLTAVFIITLIVLINGGLGSPGG